MRRRSFSGIRRRDWGWAGFAGLVGGSGGLATTIAGTETTTVLLAASTALTGIGAFFTTLIGIAYLRDEREHPGEHAPPDHEVFVGYVSADQSWADWLRDELDRAGYDVHLRPWDGAERHVSPYALINGERCVVVLLSNALLSWHHYHVADPTGRAGHPSTARHGRPIVVNVDEGMADPLVPAELGEGITLDLTGRDPDSARAALLETLTHHGAWPPEPREDERQTQPAFPGRRPAVNNLPARNPDFTGRDGLLDRISGSLGAPPRLDMPNGLTLYGMGGVGKSELILEYAHRHRSAYDVIWWISASRPAGVAASLQQLARQLGLAEATADEKPVDALWDMLRSRPRWLIIFDNVEEPEGLTRFWPLRGSGHVLVTSRTGNWMYLTECIPVDVPASEETIEMLCRWSADPDRESAAAVSHMLGYLPLALAQAAAYVGKSHISLAQYLREFQSRSEDLMRQGQPRGYAHTVMTTWSISIDQAENHAPGAADLIALLSYFASMDIPWSLPTVSPEALPQNLAQVVADPAKYEETLRALANYSLLALRDDGVHIHHLVQLAVRSGLEPPEQATWAAAATRLVEVAFPREVAQVGNWPACDRLLPHALATTDMAREAGSELIVIAVLQQRVGEYLYVQADSDQAKRMYECSLEIRESVLGDDHLDVAETLLALAQTHYRQANMDQARSAALRALEIRERRCGPEHRLVADCLAELGRIVLEMSDLETARGYTERALAMYTNLADGDERELADYYNYHGIVLWRTGRLGAAVGIHQQALAIIERRFGPQHPKVATCCEYLGILYRDLQDYDAAKRYLNRGVRIRTELFGPDHLATQKLIVHLADVHRFQRDPGLARSLLEHALRVRDRKLPENHPDVADCLIKLGAALRELGELSEARQRIQRAVQIGSISKGGHHPYVAEALVQLGPTLFSLGQPGQAGIVLSQARDIFTESYGPAHPALAEVYEYLAPVLILSGDSDQADLLKDEAGRIRARAARPE